MIKKLIFLFTLPTLTPYLIAMDLNESKIIINEAKEATIILEEQFNTLINEETPFIEEEIIELNQSKEIVLDIEEVEEINNTNLPQSDTIKTQLENNESNQTVIEILNSVDLNSSEDIHHEEHNESIDINSTEEDDNSTQTEVEGTSLRGLIIYKTRIKPFCDINGEEFAKKYMQEDWDDIYYEKEFKMEVLKACPKIEGRYKDKWTPHLYQFAVEYASDSDAIPEC